MHAPMGRAIFVSNIVRASTRCADAAPGRGSQGKPFARFLRAPPRCRESPAGLTMALNITITGNGFARFSDAVRVLGDKRARSAYSRAINHTGNVAGTAAGRALAKQTGLPARTGRKAVRRDVERSTPATLAYTIRGSGGDISLRHFKPRETRRGVSAAPFGQREVFTSTFMKAGFWPKRVEKPGWNSQVFSRLPSGKFEKVKSGVFIPREMVRGQTAQAWNTTTARLQPRIAHEIRRATKGAVT